MDVAFLQFEGELVVGGPSCGKLNVYVIGMLKGVLGPGLLGQVFF